MEGTMVESGVKTHFQDFGHYDNLRKYNMRQYCFRNLDNTKIFEKTTEKYIELPEGLLNTNTKILETLNKGSGFQGFTPDFFLKKRNLPEDVDYAEET